MNHSSSGAVVSSSSQLMFYDLFYMITYSTWKCTWGGYTSVFINASLIVQFNVMNEMMVYVLNGASEDEL